ncbi:unnamed protein product, partial [Oncorhynchus mykiss]
TQSIEASFPLFNKSRGVNVGWERGKLGIRGRIPDSIHHFEVFFLCLLLFLNKFSKCIVAFRYEVNMTTINTANINFKWDPKSLEIRTLAVERLLEPLVTQVTTLVNSSNKGPSNKKKGRSKKAHVLAASVETATLNFLDKGEKIAKESQFLKDELTAAVEDVRKQGKPWKPCSLFLWMNRYVIHMDGYKSAAVFI